MSRWIVSALLIGLVMVMALLSLAVTPGDASRALPTSTAPRILALMSNEPGVSLQYPTAYPSNVGAEEPIDPTDPPTAAPTTAPSLRVSGGGLPIASRSVLPAPTPMPRHTRFLRGQATWWFSFGHGFYVAVNPSDGIPVGTIVTVCGGTPFGCLAAPATTTCACLGRDSGRIVDLSRDLFARFADPSRGVTEVVLEW